MTPHHTFLWHDYETFGLNPRRERPSQFAGIRTDAELNEIGEPVMLYCQPANDYLPDAESCLLTGITPQLCLERGVPEHEFAAKIESIHSRRLSGSSCICWMTFLEVNFLRSLIVSFNRKGSFALTIK